MNSKTAASGNSVTQIPIIGDINNRRFLTAVLSGILGGAGVASAANLLRSYREMRKPVKKETDDDTIVLTLPGKAAEAGCSGYDGMKGAKPGETKVVSTARSGTQQMREAGKFGKRLGKPQQEKEGVKCADGNPGPNSVGSIVANALGVTAGGLLSYEAVSRMFDAMNERRLKRKLRAAQQAYVDAMAGASKRAEVIESIFAPVEHALCKGPLEKAAGILDMLPDPAANAVRYPTALYLLGLLAGTGATAYVTKKVMDKHFPEEKLKNDINRPTRIVFRTAGEEPSLLEGEEGKEKQASAETCAAIVAMLPIYMDVVEGAPNRTLAAPYVKIAQAAGTDAAGLMKMAQKDMPSVRKVVMSDPKAVWAILKGTKFGLNYSKLNAAHALRDAAPDTYRKAVDAAIDAHFAGGPNDGLVRRAWNGIARAGAKTVASLGGRDMLVDRALKAASVEDLVTSAFTPEEEAAGQREQVDEETVASRVKSRLRRRRGIAIEAADPKAARYVRVNKEAIRRLVARLNAQGSL